MEKLFSNYSPLEILAFAWVLAFAIKEVVGFVDWASGRLRKVYDRTYKSVDERKKIREEIDDLNKFYDEKRKVDEKFDKIDRTFEKIYQRIDMLIESDKEAIKAYITDRHHFFVYDQGWIDNYSLECIERRFVVYIQEHGNSFVEGLMREIRSLPKQPPEADIPKYIGTAEYVRKAKADASK